MGTNYENVWLCCGQKQWAKSITSLYTATISDGVISVTYHLTILVSCYLRHWPQLTKAYRIRIARQCCKTHNSVGSYTKCPECQLGHNWLRKSLSTWLVCSCEYCHIWTSKRFSQVLGISSHNTGVGVRFSSSPFSNVTYSHGMLNSSTHIAFYWHNHSCWTSFVIPYTCLQNY